MTRLTSSKRQLALDLQHALDDEHHIRAAGIVFVEDERGCALEGPGQQAFAELGHLLAVAQHDGVLAHQIDAADMAIEIDANAGPVEARGYLLDMGRFPGAVIALDDDAAVIGKAGQYRERGVVIEAIGFVEIGHMLGRMAEGRDLHVAIDAEGLGDGNRDIRH